MNSVDFPEFERHAPDTTLKKTIWRTFWILFGITLFDFGLYFGLHPSLMKNLLFVIFAVIKSYFIVGIFMHMRFEKLGLALIILVPVLFICALIAAALFEGHFWSTIM